MERNYKEIMPDITTFVLDVDGVLTDGSVTVFPNGELVRTMNIKDGYALKVAIDMGYKICVISGGNNPAVKWRLEGLGVTDVYLGAHNKMDQFKEFLEKNNIEPREVLYMGDDIPDLPVMKMSGLPTCPKDAVPEIREISLYVSQKNGGKGCVRDVIEQVLKVQDKWSNHFDARYD